jgi:hypothetical protein
MSKDKKVAMLMDTVEPVDQEGAAKPRRRWFPATTTCGSSRRPARPRSRESSKSAVPGRQIDGDLQGHPDFNPPEPPGRLFAVA